MPPSASHTQKAAAINHCCALLWKAQAEGACARPPCTLPPGQRKQGVRDSCAR